LVDTLYIGNHCNTVNKKKQKKYHMVPVVLEALAERVELVDPGDYEQLFGF